MTTGSVEDLNTDGQAQLAGAISKELAAVVEANGTLSVIEATHQVAGRMSIAESQVGYGIAFGRMTGAFKFNSLDYTLSPA